MPFKSVVVFLILWFTGSVVFAQSDSVASPSGTVGSDAAAQGALDSAAFVRWQMRQELLQWKRDSIMAVADSINIAWVKLPDPHRPNRFRDSLVHYYMVKNLDFQGWATRFEKLSKYEEGRLRPKGDFWTIAFIFVLLLFFAILRNASSKELTAVVQALFSNRILGQINKEEHFFNSWHFVFLYLLFGFTIGMFLYQCGKYFQLSYGYGGFVSFFKISSIVIVLYTFKIMVLRVLGFLFDEVKMVKEYTSILFLSYFNAALLFLPIVIAFSLTPVRFTPYYIYLSFILMGAIFILQFLRAISNILSGYRFPKFYLFIYLCALEICPILILMKALRF